MRQSRRIAGIGFLVGASLLLMASPAAAHLDSNNTHPHPHAGGGSSGNAIWVSVGASGGQKGSYTPCPWQPGWPTRTGTTEVRSAPGLFRSLFDALASIFGGGDDDDPSTVELVPISEADLDGDGEVDDDFIIPIFDDEEGHVIGEVKGLDSWISQIKLRLVGTGDLGVFVPGPLTGVDPDTLTEDQIETGFNYYDTSDNFPLVQRGRDPIGDVDLWWDPWFVAPEDQTGACPSGMIYSPRLNNPRIMLPDLQAFVSELLPPAVPILVPRDREEDWAYVQVPTNFMVASSSLVRKSAHAEVHYIDGPGSTAALWADIEAIPTHLVFEPGDGSAPVVCHLSNMRFVPDDPGDCSHVYLDSSNTRPGGVFETQVSVLWVGLYTDSTGLSTVVDIVPTAAGFDIAVAEARPAVSLRSP